MERWCVRRDGKIADSLQGTRTDCTTNESIDTVDDDPPRLAATVNQSPRILPHKGY